MLINILTSDLVNIFKQKLSLKDLTEIRLRRNKPIVVFVGAQPYYLAYSGLSCNVQDSIICSQDMINEIVYKASDYSIYAVNEQIKQGYIMLGDGVRIGICGNVVSENDKQKTIVSFSSLNIRIPHQVKNFSLCAFDDIIDESGIHNTLIISPPGAGKTTFIRDFLYQISLHNYCLNISVIDERGEIAGGENSKIDIGNFCDVISYTNKKDGFSRCLRSMNPNLIVTDEIGDENDFECLTNAMNCGVKVVATIHASKIEDVRCKKFFKMLPNCFFERYVLLSKREGVGTFEGVYNEKFAQIVKW